MNGWCWPDMPDPVVGRLACQFDRPVYGIEIEFARARHRPRADVECARFAAVNQPFR